MKYHVVNYDKHKSVYVQMIINLLVSLQLNETILTIGFMHEKPGGLHYWHKNTETSQKFSKMQGDDKPQGFWEVNK